MEFHKMLTAIYSCCWAYCSARRSVNGPHGAHKHVYIKGRGHSQRPAVLL